MLHRGQRGCAGAAIVSRDQDHIGVRFRDSGRNRPHPVFGDQLDMHPGGWVGVLQVVDQLRQILDGVDVVVRRRRDQSDARRGVPHFGNPRVHLVSRKLAALAGFRTLGHLDLDVRAVGQVVRGDPESGRGDLLDRAAAPIPVGIAVKSLDVFAAFTAV